ncbi:MAG: hypothetical protein JJU13_08380 [Balneolaceae bacterium]|nr:hypothetical protein [Balneolaceae bacterium]
MTHKLSDKQYVFAKFMLERIGFSDPKKIDSYINKLESIYGKYLYHLRPGKYGYYKHHYYSNSECIEQLLKEMEIKKEPAEIKNLDCNINRSKISATDLSNFQFCPASYSLSKSFEIEFPTNEDERLAGIDLHEKLRLIDQPVPEYYEDYQYFSPKVMPNESIDKIRSCELIYSGHSDDYTTFKNEEKKYVGQPDYIFKDPNGDHFIVEEKYRYLNPGKFSDFNEKEYKKYLNKIKYKFHKNHIVQIKSYIDYIKEYNIEYGVLIYWFYKLSENYNRDIYPYVHDVSIKVIYNNEFEILLNRTHNKLLDFISNQRMRFPTPTNPNKCAACVVNKYCSHKTDNYNELKLPYDKNDIQLKYIPFPDELKSDTNE